MKQMKEGGLRLFKNFCHVHFLFLPSFTSFWYKFI